MFLNDIQQEVVLGLSVLLLVALALACFWISEANRLRDEFNKLRIYSSDIQKIADERKKTIEEILEIGDEVRGWSLAYDSAFTEQTLGVLRGIRSAMNERERYLRGRVLDRENDFGGWDKV